jgi:hypothetical protein
VPQLETSCEGLPYAAEGGPAGLVERDDGLVAIGFESGMDRPAERRPWNEESAVRRRRRRGPWNDRGKRPQPRGSLPLPWDVHRPGISLDTQLVRLEKAPS